MTNIKETAPGILLSLILALPAWLLGQAFPLIGSPVFGILLGMIISMLGPTILARLPVEAGVKYTSKKLLQYSIILLGFEMNLYNIIKVGKLSLIVILFTLTASFLTAYFLGKAMGMNGKMTTLIGVGTSICGGSAIAATAPVIQAKDQDVAHAISTIFLFNIIAVLIFPALGRSLGMSDIGFGMWAGTAINDTSSVVAASSSWSTVSGSNIALAFATIVKLTRTLMIVPITLVLAIYHTRNTTSESNTSFQLVKIFPWFVIGFVAAAMFNTFAGIPSSLAHQLVTIGKFLIVMAMTAIGLNTNLRKLFTNGIRPILLGLSCWLAVAGVSLAVQAFIKLW